MIVDADGKDGADGKNGADGKDGRFVPTTSVAGFALICNIVLIGISFLGERR